MSSAIAAVLSSPSEKDHGNIHITGSQGVGIGVGGLIIILLVCFLVWYLWHRSRRRKAAARVTADAETTFASAEAGRSGATELMTSNGNSHEMQTTSNTAELHSPLTVHEMDELGESPRYEEGDGPPPEKKNSKGKELEHSGLVELEGDVAYREDPSGKGDQGRGFVMTG